MNCYGRIELQLFAEGETPPSEQSSPAQAENASPDQPERQSGGANAGIERHISELRRQGEELRRTVPGFDLAKELSNPVFLRMTSPAVALSVEDAYYAVHRRDLQEEAAKTALRQVSGAISSNRARPEENGTSGTAAALAEFDYRNAGREQREQLKQRIRRAAAHGEKVYPGK